MKEKSESCAATVTGTFFSKTPAQERKNKIRESISEIAKHAALSQELRDFWQREGGKGCVLENVQVKLNKASINLYEFKNDVEALLIKLDCFIENTSVPHYGSLLPIVKSLKVNLQEEHQWVSDVIQDEKSDSPVNKFI